MSVKCHEINTTEMSVIKSALKEKLVHTFQNFSKKPLQGLIRRKGGQCF